MCSADELQQHLHTPDPDRVMCPSCRRLGSLIISIGTLQHCCSSAIGPNCISARTCHYRSGAVGAGRTSGACCGGGGPPCSGPGPPCRAPGCASYYAAAACTGTRGGTLRMTLAWRRPPHHTACSVLGLLLPVMQVAIQPVDASQETANSETVCVYVWLLLQAVVIPVATPVLTPQPLAPAPSVDNAEPLVPLLGGPLPPDQAPAAPAPAPVLNAACSENGSSNGACQRSLA